jgi:hypothetical protein
MRSQNYVRDETRCGGGGPKVSLATVSRKIPVGSQQTPSGVGRVVDVKRVPGGKKSCGPFCYLRVAEAGRRLEDDFRCWSSWWRMPWLQGPRCKGSCDGVRACACVRAERARREGGANDHNPQSLLHVCIHLISCVLPHRQVWLSDRSMFASQLLQGLSTRSSRFEVRPFFPTEFVMRRAKGVFQHEARSMVLCCTKWRAQNHPGREVRLHSCRVIPLMTEET